MHLSLVFDFFSLCLKKFFCFELLQVVEDFIVVIIIVLFFVFCFSDKVLDLLLLSAFICLLY
jgi:hypothetical protein